MNADEFVTHLEGVRRLKPGRWIAKCPSHQDRMPSLSIGEGDDGRVLVHCFAGCDPELIAIGAGVQFADLFPDRMGHVPPKRRPPFDACVAVLGHQSLVLLVIANDMLAGKLDKAELHKAIAKIDEVRRVLA